MDEQKIYYSVKNLRSIEKMDSIELKKINILIGKNSVGKSTFLRSLWLLRRSVTQKAGAPILWYGGPGDQIDFGDFETSIFKNSVAIY
jgi:predicted ATPase